MEKRKVLTVLFLCLLLPFEKALAGWFHCENYKGTVGRANVSLSLQYLRGHDGDEDNIVVKAVYLYDMYHQPIKLEGEYSDGYFVLREELPGGGTAVISLQKKDGHLSGTWQAANTEQLAVELSRTATLDLQDEQGVIEHENMQIYVLQYASFDDYYIVGNYQQTNGEACMLEVQLRRKQDGSLFQALPLYGIDQCQGQVHTIIYGNVLAEDMNGDGYNDVKVWSHAGSYGLEVFQVFYYLPEAGKFDTAPEEIAFGGSPPDEEY